MSRFYRIQPPLLAPLPEGEQHLQQVGVVDDAVFGDVFVARVACACAAEGEQHGKQIGVVDAAVTVCVARAPFGSACALPSVNTPRGGRNPSLA